MNVPVNTRAAAYLRTLIIVSAVLTLATLVLRFGKGLFLAPLNLSNENVAAAWFQESCCFWPACMQPTVISD